jgi:hypothetical protein
MAHGFPHNSKSGTGDHDRGTVLLVITGNSIHALQFSRAMFQRGVNVQPILCPGSAIKPHRFLSHLLW